MYPLEIESATSDDPIDAVNNNSPQRKDEQVQQPERVELHSRLKRAATQRANQFLKLVVSQLKDITINIDLSIMYVFYNDLELYNLWDSPLNIIVVNWGSVL